MAMKETTCILNKWFALVMSCEDGAKQGNVCDKVTEGYFPERIAMLQQSLLPADQGQQIVPESSR